MDLNILKYSELQKLAKAAGIKANLRHDKLRSALEEHFAAKNKYANTKKRSTVNSPFITNDKEHGGSAIKSKRRRTFEKEESDLPKAIESVQISRQSTNELIMCMDAAEGESAMKQSLMDAINKKVAKRLKGAPKTNTPPVQEIKSTASKIPQFKSRKTGNTLHNNKAATPVNKNWSSIHHKHFEKMDSLDVYLEKKKSRAKNLLSASKSRTSNTISQLQNTIDKLQSYSTPEAIRDRLQKVHAKPKLFPTPNKSAPFKPSVLSTKDMNINFASIKSPAIKFTAGPKILKPVVAKRKSPRLQCHQYYSVTVKTPKLKGSQQTSVGNGQRLPLPSSKTSAFNLKESLSRPLTWVPYTGKVQPLLAPAKNGPPRKNLHDMSKGPSIKSKSHLERRNIKTPPVKNTRDDRRKIAMQSRAEKQFAEQMKRRGLKV